MSLKPEGAAALPADLNACVAFHGHLCPGLVYGYLVARAAIDRLGIQRSRDEEVVAIAENDSCAVDGLQALLGTTLGKGNLICRDYGKNVYTVVHRGRRRALRFARKAVYAYQGSDPQGFAQLEAAVAAGTATDEQRRRQKLLKARDLLAQPVDAVFDIQESAYEEPPYARLARSVACAGCGEMTMATKMAVDAEGRPVCRPCFGRTS